jgi:hypothetical protein
MRARLYPQVFVHAPFMCPISIVFGRREARQAIRRQVKYQRVSLSLTRQLARTGTLNCREQPHDSEKIQLVRGFFKARQYFRDIRAVQRD